MGLDSSKHGHAPIGRFDSHEARDQRFLVAAAGVSKEPRVGWLTIALTVALAIMAVAILGYLTICPSRLR